MKGLCAGTLDCLHSARRELRLSFSNDPKAKSYKLHRTEKRKAELCNDMITQVSSLSVHSNTSALFPIKAVI